MGLSTNMGRNEPEHGVMRTRYKHCDWSQCVHVTAVYAEIYTFLRCALEPLPHSEPQPWLEKSDVICSSWCSNVWALNSRLNWTWFPPGQHVQLPLRLTWRHRSLHDSANDCPGGSKPPARVSDSYSVATWRQLPRQQLGQKLLFQEKISKKIIILSKSVQLEINIPKFTDHCHPIMSLAMIF